MTEDRSEKMPASDRITRARHRRTRRAYADQQEHQRIYFLDELSSHASTSIEFLISALISGTLIGAGFRFNQLVLIIAGTLLAPRMAPVLGLAMGSILGQVRTVVRVFLNLVILIVIIMVTSGIIGGMGSGQDVFEGIILQYTRINLLDFAFIVFGTVVLAILVVQDGVFSPLPSAVVAYEILLPLGACAVGIMGMQQGIWLGALLNFALHTSWAVAAGMVVFLVMGFRPVSSGVRTYAFAVLIMSCIVILSLLSLGGSILLGMPSSTPAVVVSPPTLSPTSVPSMTPTPLPPVTETLIIETSTPPPPSETPRPSTATPAPSLGVIVGTGGLGVVMRDAPNGVRVGGLFDGAEVEIIGGPVEIEATIWMQIRTRDGIEGWVLSGFLATATPAP